jgi:hypothetical protein
MSRADLELVRKIEDLQAAYIAIATSDGGNVESFDDLRRDLLDLPVVADLLPEFVHRYRTRAQFWQYIKQSLPTYAERRGFIWDGFHKAIEYAEGARQSPSDLPVEQGLASLEASHIHELWTKALQRRSDDPEGAITAARALLESVCKLILDEAGETYQEGAELPKLYGRAAQRLNLAPSQHTEQVFKQILGGCQSVVEGIGAVRNRLSDAHGKGRQPVRPAPRHAELVVNLAGAMAVFLSATWIQFRDHAA